MTYLLLTRQYKDRRWLRTTEDDVYGRGVGNAEIPVGIRDRSWLNEVQACP
jgi:hypothetical protein